MMRSLYSGVSGLKTHQTKMDVIGNNIANVNTVAFKSSSVTFGELMYQTTSNASSPDATTGRGGINAKQIGLGVQMGATNVSITTTGATQTTGNPFDLKITGDSFFIVSDGSSNYFTRAGAFYVDAVGNLAMTSTGYNVMGWQVGNDGKIIQNTVSPIKVLSAEHMFSQPEATTLGTCSGVLDKSDPNLTSSNGKVLSLSIYDDLGYEYTAKFSVTPFKNATTTTKQVTNTSTTYTKLPTIKEWTTSDYKFKIMANDADQNGSEITTYTTPGGLYDALVKYASPYDASQNPHGHGLSDKDVIDFGDFYVLQELATLMDLNTSTIPTRQQFMNDPDIVGKKVRVGKTDVTSYTVEENGSSTPLEGMQKETLEALKTAGVIDNGVYYEPHRKTMHDLVGEGYVEEETVYTPTGGKSWADLMAAGKVDVDPAHPGNFLEGARTWDDLEAAGLVEDDPANPVQYLPAGNRTWATLAAAGLVEADPANPGSYIPKTAETWASLEAKGKVEADSANPGSYLPKSPETWASLASAGLVYEDPANPGSYLPTNGQTWASLKTAGLIKRDPAHPGVKPTTGNSWEALKASGDVIDDPDNPRKYIPINGTWTDLLSQDLVTQGIEYKPAGNNKWADLVTAGVVEDLGGGNYQPKKWTMTELINDHILMVDPDSPGGYKVDPANTKGYTTIEQVIAAGYIDALQDVYTPKIGQDLVRYEKRSYDGEAPSVSYTLVDTSGTAPGTKTPIDDPLKNVSSAQMGIFLGAGSASDISIYDTNEPVTKTSYIDGQYSVKLLELIDLANGKNSMNVDILGDTSRDLMFDTNDGKFRYIGAEGQTSYDLHLSALGGNFKDINIDFSTVKNVSNEGTSTMGMKAGDEDGEGGGKLLGALKGVSVDSNGMIYGSYDNGNTELLGQIAVTEFANASGLEKVGENLYQTTLNSGEFDGIGRDISSLSGSMTTGVLEMSNVDLSAEFTDMITTQRGFQANSRIITTSDTLLEELINLKR